MRLIDADAFDNELRIQQAKYDIDGNQIGYKLFEAMRIDLSHRPTIDAAPVVHGKWVENKYGYMTCSNCDSCPLEARTGSLITMHYEPYESEYCPHCGAKMDLE